MLLPVLLCRCIVGTADGAGKESRGGVSHLCQASPSTIPHRCRGLCLGPAQITPVERHGKPLRQASRKSP